MSIGLRLIGVCVQAACLALLFWINWRIALAALIYEVGETLYETGKYMDRSK